MSLHNNHFLLPQNSAVPNGENGKKGNPLLKAWGEQLERWCIAAGWPQQTVAYRTDVSERTVRDWMTGRAAPRTEKLAALIVALYDAKQVEFVPMGLESNSLNGRNGHIWQQPQEVFDWLALLGLDEAVVIGLNTNASVKKWLSTALTNALPWSSIPLPTMYVEREAGQEMVTALCKRRSYRKPYHRVVVLHGPPGSGKSTLAAAVMGNTSIRSFFRSGGQWLPNEDMKWLMVNGPHLLVAEVANNPWDRWWKWLTDETTVGLVVVDDLNDPDLFTELLRRAGPQIQFIITTQNRDKAQAGLGHLATNEVLHLPIGGFSQTQAESFLSQLWERPLDEEDYQYLSRVLIHLNRPEPLRLLAGEVAEVGWEEVWQWLFEGQDQETPLADHWQRLLSKAWTRCEQTERIWLGQIAAAVQHGSTFGCSFAALVWSKESPGAERRLFLLERRGWIEQVDEITPKSVPHLAILLGNKRYRLLRESWTFIQKQSSIKVGLKDRLKWAGQLTLQWQKQMDVSWQQLGSSMWKRLKNLGRSLDKEGGHKYADHRLERWFIQNWIQHGVWPPEELWLVYEASTRGRWGLFGLRVVPAIVGTLALMAVTPIAPPILLSTPSIVALMGGSSLLEFLGQAAIVDLPYDLMAGGSPVLAAPESVPELLLGQSSSQQNNTLPLLNDND